MSNKRKKRRLRQQPIEGTKVNFCLFDCIKSDGIFDFFIRCRTGLETFLALLAYYQWLNEMFYCSITFIEYVTIFDLIRCVGMLATNVSSSHIKL